MNCARSKGLKYSMKTLMITLESPVAAYGGGQRVLSLKKAFESLGEVRVLHLVPKGREGETFNADYTAPSDTEARTDRNYWRKRQLLFSDFRPYEPARRRIEEIRKEYPFDVAICHLFRSAPAAPVDMVPCFLDSDLTPVPSSKFSRLLWPLTRRVMNARAKQFARIFVIRPSDQEVLSGAKTTYLPCISTSAKAPLTIADDLKNLLFVGNVKAWPPNRESVEYLVKDLAPRLSGTGYRLRLVGDGTQDYAGAENVSAPGFVDDLEAEYRNAAVVLCPIWSGFGANVKMAEALQYGAAIVTTNHAVTGFDGVIKAGEHVLAGEGRDDVTSVILDLLKNPERMKMLRARATELGASILNQENLNAIVAKAVAEELHKN